MHSHVEVELQSQNIDFAQEISDAEHSARRSGSWNTEEYFTKLSQLLRKHAIRRLYSIYQKLYRIILSRVGKLDHEINVEIVRILSFYAEPQKEYLGQFLPARWKELSIYGKVIQSTFNSNLYRYPEESEWLDILDLTIENYLKQYEQYLCLILVEQQHQRETGMSEPSIKIMGSVGVIQTGGGSFAISTQKNIQPIYKDLNNALNSVEDGIVQARSDFVSGQQTPLSSTDMANIMEAVAKCRSELTQDRGGPSS